MSSVRPLPADTRSLLRELFVPIEDDLAEVERRLQQELRHNDAAIDKLAQHSFRIGGKRLRPALLLLSAQAVGEVNDAHHTLAAVVEMIHTATLVHDDVLDEATLRRHEETVNARWGNRVSILLGDYLFTHAFYLASKLDTTFGCRTIGRSTNLVCEGELLQNAASGNFQLSRDEYLRIIDAKTAELCACCCRLGAHYAGGDESTVDHLESFGRRLGTAFQIVDDVLDLEGDEQTTGKSLGTDLAKRKMTLPLIYLRDQLDDDQRRQLQDLFEGPDNGRLLDWLERDGALDHAREVASSCSQLAADKLAAVPESTAKQSLLLTCQFVTRRTA